MMTGKKAKTAASSTPFPALRDGQQQPQQQPAAASSTPPPPATPAPAAEKERLDQRLKKKIQAFRAKRKERTIDNGDSQKRNSESGRKKKNNTIDKDRTIEKSDSKKTREETITEEAAPIPPGTPAWKIKKVEELVKGDMIFGKRMSCKISDCICVEEHGRVFKAFSTKQMEGLQPPKKDKDDAFPVALKTDIATGTMKKWFTVEKDVLLAISLLRPCSITNHFPQIFDSGELYNFRYLMMSLHGPNLERLRRDILKADFTVGTALRVSYQILTAVVDLHLIGYLHRDLKPTNFVIGMDTGSEWFLRSTNLRTVYMVGFGTCVKKKVALERSERRFVNLTFGSRKSHNLTHVLDKNDDIESWLFLSVELFKRGSLPWRRKTVHAEILVMKQKFFDEIGFNGMYDFTPEQFKTIIQKSFVEISEGKSINTHFIRESFREISKKSHITNGMSYDWETGTGNRRLTLHDGDAPIDGGAKKWMIPKGMQQQQKATGGKNATTTEEEIDDDDKQESTRLDDAPTVMLKAGAAAEKNNNNNENNGATGGGRGEDAHSCLSLDPTITQKIIKDAVDNDVKLRNKIPKAIPPDDPLLKLTLNKSKKYQKVAAATGGANAAISPRQFQQQQVAARIVNKLDTNNMNGYNNNNRMRNGLAPSPGSGVPAGSMNNGNMNASTNNTNNNNLVMRIKRDGSEERNTTTEEN